MNSTQSNAWAKGCERCSYGVVDAMPLTRVCDVITERIVQMDDGLITFCDCQAGQAYRRNLARYRDQLIDEACKHPKMERFARRATHLDIENARNAMQAMQTEPTFQGAEQEPA